jgi:NAD(P)-dependent dehydrogenase (short-subunit alcohol dehydrogenase family)
MMNGDVTLQGKVAVVTGASRGIGRHIAQALAGHGASVVLVARNEQQLQEAEYQMRQAGGTAIAMPTDVSDPGAVDILKASVTSALGPPAILVNAAGVIGPLQLIAHSDPQRWIETLMINTVSPYLTCRAFVDGMLRAGWGRIVNVSSAASLGTPGPLSSAYATSKVALNHLTRHLAAEVDDTGVTANVIHPGEVKTDMWAMIRDQAALAGPEGEGYRHWASWVEETGGDPPHKACDLVMRLMTDEAARINGQFLWIEDGLISPMPSWSTV